jgi:proline racemase
VNVVAYCRDGKCERVKVTNVPCYVERLDLEIEVEGIGRVRGDIVYGGAFFFIVEAARFGFALVPEEARRIVELGNQLTRAARKACPVAHPHLPEVTGPTFTKFVAPLARGANGVLEGRNALVVSPGKIDRSPCGTGTSAWMALLHHRGELAVGDAFVSRSILDARFDCRIEAETHVESRPAILPSFTGRAWITDISTYLLDPTDPFPCGYTLTDTWMERL